jgi:acetylornithine deacetylase/succinyl-diaminopimelate desuccinylase-like protein
MYSHYDVIRASSDGWDSDPYTLTGRNGYLYGRGATDNKGPILAFAAAAAELLRQRSLAVDLVFLVEGEEERGSGGFEAAVRKHRVSALPGDRPLSVHPFMIFIPCMHFWSAIDFISSAMCSGPRTLCLAIQCTLQRRHGFEWAPGKDH